MGGSWMFMALSLPAGNLHFPFFRSRHIVLHETLQSIGLFRDRHLTPLAHVLGAARFSNPWVAGVTTSTNCTIFEPPVVCYHNSCSLFCTSNDEITRVVNPMRNHAPNPNCTLFSSNQPKYFPVLLPRRSRV